MAIEALIFDVDGTMADTEEAHRVAFNLAFERFRLGWVWNPTEYRELLRVTGGKERVRAYIDQLALTVAERRRLLEMVPSIHMEKTKFYTAVVNDGGVSLRDGVARLLDEARHAGCRLAIASTTTAANVDALLQSALGCGGLEMFNVIACGDQVQAKKPAPDIYRLALRHLGLEASQGLAFEDSCNGLRSAHAAGLWTVVTPTFWTQGDDLSAADLLLPRLGDPDDPIGGEPGGRLQTAGWLTIDELMNLAAPAPAANRVQALYEPGVAR